MAKTHVVYILGAGFSAPLGIPTIASFLQDAKNLQERDSERFGYFDRIFDSIQVLERAHNFYRTDRTSIEDLLTIVDLRDGLTGEDQAQLFKRFIADVVRSYTPDIVGHRQPQRWYDVLFGASPWAAYGVFVSALLGYEFLFKGTGEPTTAPTLSDYECRVANPNVRYSVISLNYDMVLERMAEHITKTFHRKERAFVSTPTHDGPPLVKLHGSVDADNIVPPLWNKEYTGMASVWRQAFTILTSANQLRIVGYSLPEADSYARYLLRSAAVETRNLQRIDVLCKDDDGRVQRRYKNFITFRNYYRGKTREGSFNKGDSFSYLSYYQSITEQWPKLIRPSDLLESTHGQHFRGL